MMMTMVAVNIHDLDNNDDSEDVDDDDIGNDDDDDDDDDNDDNDDDDDAHLLAGLGLRHHLTQLLPPTSLHLI